MYTLPTLKYDYHTLSPVIDPQTMEIHHTRHHQAYIDKLNAGLQTHPEYADRSLEELLDKIKELPDSLQGVVRNHGGGHHNHSLFWDIMRAPREDNRPHPDSQIGQAISQTFESFEAFQSQFSDKAVGHFGSGWCWLVSLPSYQEGSGEIISNIWKKLEIITTANQDSPLMNGKTPLLCVDLREHAYYLHYQNKRADYVSARWSVVDWERVNENFDK